MMDADGRVRINEAFGLSDGPDLVPEPQRICQAAVRLTQATGAGLTLTINSQLAAIWTSGDFAQAMEDLQFGLGEGPALSASRVGAVILESHLADSKTWPFFSPAALDLGLRAAFAFPLVVNTTCFGAFALYRDTPGPLQAVQLRDALALARLAAYACVEVEAQGCLLRSDYYPAERLAPVHQACGMVAAQLGSDMRTALAAIRAHGYAYGMTLYEVADQLLRRRLRLGPHPLPWP